MQRWYPAFVYFRQRFGARLQKIVLDRPGARCPNRDSVAGRTGCTFCNPLGSGSGLAERTPDLRAQWDHWRAHYGARAGLCMAYFQSFTNTHGPARELRALLEAVRDFPAIAGLAVGTRPDCVDEEKIDILASCPLPEIWLELGLQSAHDATLTRIGRGHDVAASERAVRLAAQRGLRVCGHLMAGLPGESGGDFLETIRWAASLPLAGVKIHSLYVCRGSALESEHAEGRYAPLKREEYVDLLAGALPLLPSRLVIQRLTSDPAPGELIAPLWTARKAELLAELRALLEQRDEWQGRLADAPDGVPEWFEDERATVTGRRRQARQGL